MTTPHTSLDERYSEPDSSPTSWEQARQVLADAELSWLTTVRADGRPHQTPVVSVWHDGVPYFCTGTEEQKAINLSHNPHVLLTVAGRDWDKGLDVVVEGDAERITDQAALRGVAAAWATKWDGRWNYEATDGGFVHPGVNVTVLVYAVRPAKVLAFGQGSFTHTRHQFG